MTLARLHRGDDRAALTVRLALSTLLLVVSAGGGLAALAPSALAAGPGGSSGSVKIDGRDLSVTDPANDPKLDCEIPVQFQGFEQGKSFTARIDFEGAGNQPDPFVSGGDQDPTFVGKGGGSAIDLVETFYIAGSNHIKVTVTVDSGYRKFKVFKVNPCGAPSFDVEKTSDAGGNGAYTDDETAAAGGEDVEFKVVVTNTSPYSIDVTSVKDAVGTAAPAAVSCTPALGTILAGKSATCFFEEDDHSVSGAAVTDVVTVVAHQLGDSANATSKESNVATVRAPAAGKAPLPLTVVKSNDADGDTTFTKDETAAAASADVPFQVKITNDSTVSVDVTSVTDTVDGQPASPAVDCASTTAGWPTIGAGGVATCTFTMDDYSPADGAAAKSNVVTVAARQSADATNTTSKNSNASSVKTVVPVVVTPKKPTFTVQKVNDADGKGGFSVEETTSSAGASVPFKATITNTSDFDITVSSVKDSVDGGALVDVSCGTITVAPKASEECLFTLPSYSPADQGAKRNVLTVAAHETGRSTNAETVQSNTSVVRTDVPTGPPPPPSTCEQRGDCPPPQPQPGDLAVKKTGPASAEPGDTLTWALTVTSKGPGASRDFTVTDVVPAGVTLTSLTGAGFTCDLAAATCRHPGALQAGATAVVTAVGTLSSGYATTSVTNAVEVAPTDATPDDNRDSLVTVVELPTPPPGPGQADLVLAKTAPSAAVEPGDDLEWQITVTNAGTAAASGFTVTDDLADGLSLVSAAGVGFDCGNGPTVQCVHAGELAPGAVASLVVRTTLDDEYDSSSVSNTAAAPLAGDPTPDNNSDAATAGVDLPISGSPTDPGSGPTDPTDPVDPTDPTKPTDPKAPTKKPDAPGAPAEPIDGRTTEQPATLPFTGGSTDLLLGLGAGLSILGLLLALTGRRRRLAE